MLDDRLRESVPSEESPPDETDQPSSADGQAAHARRYPVRRQLAIAASDVHTQQCSLNATVKDLAEMGATLADGGVNPLTKERVVDATLAKRVLAALATAGLYERSGDCLFEIGLPGKSGVSGGIVSVSPGKGGLGTYSPLLDSAGNSIKGLRVTKFLSERLGNNLFASKPSM